MFGGYDTTYSVTYSNVYSFELLAGGPLSAGGTGVWTKRAGSLLTGRGDFATVTSADGRVHVYGGYAVPDFCNPLASHELYDPVADSFVYLAPLPARLAEKDDGVLVDGLIISIGGETKSDSVGCGDTDIMPLTAVYAYSAATDAWSVVATLPDGRMRFASAVVDSTVYTFGGQGALLDVPSDSPFLPILYTAFTISAAGGAAGGGGAASGGGAACGAYGGGAVAGAAIGAALGALMLQAGTERWRRRTSGSDASRLHRLPLP